MITNSDTIVAVSTPHGRGGIGVIRISGALALDHMRGLLGVTTFDPAPRKAYYKVLHDPSSSEVLDESVLTYFASPKSFTGEDVVELSCHGSPVVLTRIVDVLISLGCRPAKAGEFTLRALANKRLDVNQAEAIRDLIDSQSYAAASQALRQMSGELSAQLHPILAALMKIIVPLESSLEFVEEDLPAVYIEQIKHKLNDLIYRLDNLAKTYHTGRLIRNGLRVVLLGKPNVGKSSIFNELLAYERSIVTDVPGTTRDSLNETITVNDVPVVLTDTAGVRDSLDPVEQIGIERSKRAAIDADLLLLVFDATSEFTDEDELVLHYARSHKHLIVVNKCDSGNETISKSLLESVNDNYLQISVSSGLGFGELRSSISNAVNNSLGSHDEGAYMITSARHYDLLVASSEALRMSIASLEQNASEEIVLIGLYNALRSIGAITGETTSDDVLGQIFSTFCIGK